MTSADPRSPENRGQVRRPRPKPAPIVRRAADSLPIARVAVDISLTHLDRPFDYLVPEQLAEVAQPGVRVKVRFAGKLTDGFVLDRLAVTDHDGKLGFLEKVVSADPVLAPEIAVLARTVADRYVGSLADVLRLAVPPRHARAEASARPAPDQPPTTAAAAQVTPGWLQYPQGAAFLSAVAKGAAARAVWQQAPGERWPQRLAEAASVAHRAGRGALVLVPDARDLRRLEAAFAEILAPEEFTVLSADLGPAERYRRFLAVRRGAVRVVAGTRGAAFAPVVDPALFAIVDDGDDLFAEPRAPYPHAREVLMLRSVAAGCALLLAGVGRTAEAQLLVESRWTQEIVADRATIRARSPRIEAQGDTYAVGASSAAAGARLSPAAFAAAREAVEQDTPVLVQVPRSGYLPSLTCTECRRPARCRRCHGPLGILVGHRIPACRWCGVPEAHFVCGACGGHELRASGQGARRTAEELGRAFPNVPLITSAGDTIRESVPAAAAIVVATPGAEPIAEGGYGAALLLDGGLMLSRPDLRAAEQALARWLSAAALVRSAATGGRVVLGIDGSIAAAQALIRWDPVRHAEVELAGRRELGFPPITAMISLTGSEQTVTAAVEDLQLPPGAEVLGPVPVEYTGPGRPGAEDEVRALLRTSQSGRKALAAAVRVLTAARSARKDATPPRVQVDPSAIL
ncbi:MAG: primosomal protein N' [Nakamurella sp.]